MFDENTFIMKQKREHFDNNLVEYTNRNNTHKSKTEEEVLENQFELL